MNLFNSFCQVIKVKAETEAENKLFNSILSQAKVPNERLDQKVIKACGCHLLFSLFLKQTLYRFCCEHYIIVDCSSQLQSTIPHICTNTGIVIIEGMNIQ